MPPCTHIIYPLISPVDPSTYPVPRSHGLRPCPLCRTDQRAIHTLPCMMASAHVHCDGHASAPSDTSCIRLDGHRPCTEHLGPLHRTSGQASAPLESVEESAPLHSLSGQASALSSSGMSAFSKPQLTRHNHVAQRLCTWGTRYKPSVLASPAEWRRYPSDTSGGRPLTEAMISYPERASAVDGDVHRII